MRLILSLAAVALSGCMTLEQVPTAGTDRLFDAACMNPSLYGQEVSRAAMSELFRRNTDCRQLAMMVLQMRQGNPIPAPAPLQPYVMQPPPAFQSSPTFQAPVVPAAPAGVHATLQGSYTTTTVTGQAAYVCRYLAGNRTAEVIRPVANGPCDPTMTLR